MKTPKRIRIIASNPSPGQTGIEDFIGLEFYVPRGRFDSSDRTVHVRIMDGHKIVLQPTEYEVLES